MKLSTKVAYNTIIQIAGKAVSTLLGLAAVAIITRYLGQTGFGQYSTVLAFVSFFAILSDFGLTLVTSQMISRDKKNEKKILNNIFSFRLVTSVFFLGIAPAIVFAFPYSPEVKIGIAITTFAYLFAALNQVFVGLFQKNLRMDKDSVAEVAGRVVLVAGFWLAVQKDLGLLGILSANIIAAAVNFVIHYVLSLRVARIKLEWDFSLWRQIIHKTWPIAITIAFNLIYLKTDTLILSVVKSQADVGIYGAAYKVVDVLNTVPFMFAGIVMPILTMQWVENNLDKFKQVLQKAFEVMVILSVPVFVGAQFLGEPIMRLVAGDDFSVSGSVLKVLALASVMVFIGSIFAHAIVAIDKQKKVIKAYIFTAITSLVGYFVFIPEYSYMGAAWMTVYSEAMIAAASLYYIWKFSRFSPGLKIIFKTLAASAGMGLGLFLTPDRYYDQIWGLAGAFLAAVFVYFALIYLLKGLNKEDILSLLNK